VPTYEYACRGCGQHLEVVQSFKDDALTECPSCHGELRKVFSAAGIIFKGSGWHVKDYASSSKSGSAAPSGDAGGEKGSSDGASSTAGGSSSSGDGGSGDTGSGSSSGSNSSGSNSSGSSSSSSSTGSASAKSA
jgi:putative FmdB family regulatory protein